MGGGGGRGPLACPRRPARLRLSRRWEAAATVGCQPLPGGSPPFHLSVDSAEQFLPTVHFQQTQAELLELVWIGDGLDRGFHRGPRLATPPGALQQEHMPNASDVGLLDGVRDTGLSPSADERSQ